MSLSPASGSGPDARAEALASAYERAGYTRLAPPILQPAEPFLDLSGEDIRKRMYLTTAPGGAEMCLRPDLTIPVAREYLASSSAGKPASFCYLGPVFRHRSKASAEFMQLGVESFGRTDQAAADAEMLALALEAAAHYGVAGPLVQVGDVALFAALIGALDLAPAWKRRLAMWLADPHFLAVETEALAKPWVARARRRMPVYTWTVCNAGLRRQASVHADAAIWENDGRP